ncbi:hypothetical protein [Streptomyces sp. NPDC057429]|uniref:hypothetical protein n=1 Tax=Streptomyces sp. NPDC057429 TaxID=3346130 RepID=UPI003694F49F
MGRPPGPLRGRTAQANALASWLRALTQGVTVRELESQFPYSRAAWSTYYNGSILIPKELLKDLLKRYGLDSQERQEGLRLLREAEAAARYPEVGQAPVRPARTAVVAEAFLRLDEARVHQMEAMRKLAESEKRCEQLQSVVSMLNSQCTQLKLERDRAREDARAELQSELCQSLECQRQADEQLEHARRAQREAHEIRMAAEEHVVREQLTLQQMQDAGDAGEETPTAPAHTEPVFDVPPLDQISVVLRVAAEQLAEQDRDLDVLREQVGLRPVDRVPEGPMIVPGQVVDSTENDQAAVVPSTPADHLDNDPVEVWATATAAIPSSAGWTGRKDDHATVRAPGTTAGPSSETALLERLAMVHTPHEFGKQLRALCSFRHPWRAGEMVLAVLHRGNISPGLITAQELLTAQNWLEGTLLPYEYQLDGILRASGVNPEVARAFRDARSRLEASHPKLMPSYHHRALGWSAVSLGVVVIATLAATYMAAVKADPGPSVLLLLGAAVAGLIFSAAVWAAGVVISWGREPSVIETASMVAFFGVPFALPAGLVIQWIPGLDAWGRWLAENIGLL